MVDEMGVGWIGVVFGFVDISDGIFACICVVCVCVCVCVDAELQGSIWCGVARWDDYGGVVWVLDEVVCGGAGWDCEVVGVVWFVCVFADCVGVDVHELGDYSAGGEHGARVSGDGRRRRERGGKRGVEGGKSGAMKKVKNTPLTGVGEIWYNIRSISKG